MTIKLPERDPRMLIRTNLWDRIAALEKEHNVKITQIQVEHGERGNITGITIDTEDKK